MNNTLLIDVDSKIPNIALMKLSEFFKNKGDIVQLKQLHMNYYPHYKKYKKFHKLELLKYDKVYISSVFNTHKVFRIPGKNVVYGGTGYDIHSKLPKEVDRCRCDYSIYKDNDTSFGFITRGCIRNCHFCIVPKKEGNIHKVNDVKEIVKHKKVNFLDNNILAYEQHEKILREIIDLDVKCKFSQGLDIRLINNSNAKLISELKYIGSHYFAFDCLSLKDLIDLKLRIVRKYIKHDWKIRFYVFVHPKMSLKETFERLDFCKEHKVLAYLMRDIDCWKSNLFPLYRDLASYVNQANFFIKQSFEDFLNLKYSDKRYKNEDAIEIYSKYKKGLID